MTSVLFCMTRRSARSLKTFWSYHLAQRERAHGVQVHIFHPGYVQTPGTDDMAREWRMAADRRRAR